MTSTPTTYATSNGPMRPTLADLLRACAMPATEDQVRDCVARLVGVPVLHVDDVVLLPPPTVRFHTDVDV